MSNLKAKAKSIASEKLEQVLDIIRKHSEGSEYVRVKLYDDDISEDSEVSFEIYSSSAWDNQSGLEIYGFKQADFEGLDDEDIQYKIDEYLEYNWTEVQEEIENNLLYHFTN